MKKRSFLLYNNNKSKQQTQSSERFRSRRQPVPPYHNTTLRLPRLHFFFPYNLCAKTSFFIRVVRRYFIAVIKFCKQLIEKRACFSFHIFK